MKKRKLLSLLLVFAMCLTLIPMATVPVQADGHSEKHCICGITYCEAHGLKEWRAWTSSASLPTEAGNYYLTQNVTLDGAWECKDEVNLCLNGKTIESKGKEYTIIVNPMGLSGGGNLTITDCKTTGQIRPSSLMVKDAIVYVFMGSKFTLWNGSITGDVSGTYGGVHNLGTFTMNGGSIRNNYFITNGGGVYNENAFIMNGGSISGNIATNGGGVYNLGDFIMNGGSITGNTAGSGGGVYNVSGEKGGGTFTVSGNVNISGNKNATDSNAANNVYLADDKAITVSGSLSNTAKVGIFGKGGTTLVSGTTGKTVVSGTTSVTGFNCDNTGYQLINDGSNGLMLVQKHTHNWNSALSHDDTHHWHDCSNENCYITAESKKDGYAAHNYNKTVATEAYLKSAATCTAKAVYYKSCECGAKSATETFESGEVLPHTPAAAVEENRVEATCEENGSYDEVVYCSDCNVEISRTPKTINKLNHNVVYMAAKAPTCTEVGWEAYAECTRPNCNYTTKKVIPAKGHTYGILYPAREATCTSTGSEAYYQCSVCGSYFNKDKVEKTLSELTIAALGHSWSRYTVTTPATTESEGTETRTCQRSDCTEKQTRTIAKLSAQTYNIGGTVLNSNDTSAKNVSVSLILGDRQIQTKSTGSDGSYTFSGIEPGVYNIIAESESKDRTRTVKVEVTNGDVTVEDIKLPAEATSAVVDIKSDIEGDKVEAVVGNLDVLADAQNAEIKARIEIKLILEKIKENEISNDIKTQIPQNNVIGMSFDLGIQKTVTPNGSSNAVVTPITDTGDVLLATTIMLPTQLQDKQNYNVYRLHNDGVNGAEFQTLTTTPNSAGEYIAISSDKKSLTINAKCYSEYVIAYQEKRKSSGSSHTAAYQEITSVQPENGEVLMSSASAKSGETVTITLKPEEGYVADSVTVLDKDGKAIELTDKGEGVYTFTMPNGEVSVSAAFKKAADKGKDYADCSKDSACSVEKFADAKNTAWYHDGVHYCLDSGLMVGTSDTTFSPNDNITRAQIVTMLWRLEGSQSVAGNGYKDVKSDAYYSSAVAWASENSIVDGYGDENFGPNDSITREQLAAIMYRYAKFKSMDVSVGEDTNILDFDDATSISTYAVPAIQWACGSGVMNGTDTFKISPKGTATRAQAACIMQRFLTGNK